jgi:hypothetical protein
MQGYIFVDETLLKTDGHDFGYGLLMSLIGTISELYNIWLYAYLKRKRTLLLFLYATTSSNNFMY